MIRHRPGPQSGMPQPALGLDELMIVNPSAGDGLAILWGSDGRLHSLRPLPASRVQPSAACCCGNRYRRIRVETGRGIGPATGKQLLEICLMDADGRIYRPIGRITIDR